MINHVFISFSAVQIYEISYIHLDTKSVAGFFSFPPDKQAAGCQDSFKMAASEVVSLETNFFRIAGTFEAETSVGRKAEYLLAIGGDKKK